MSEAYLPQKNQTPDFVSMKLSQHRAHLSNTSAFRHQRDAFNAGESQEFTKGLNEQKVPRERISGLQNIKSYK